MRGSSGAAGAGIGPGAAAVGAVGAVAFTAGSTDAGEAGAVAGGPPLAWCPSSSPTRRRSPRPTDNATRMTSTKPPRIHQAGRRGWGEGPAAGGEAGSGAAAGGLPASPNRRRTAETVSTVVLAGARGTGAGL